MSQNSSSGKKRRTVNRSVKFEDVAGVDIAKAELMEVCDLYCTLKQILPGAERTCFVTFEIFYNVL
jgi:hypothetical protein